MLTQETYSLLKFHIKFGNNPRDSSVGRAEDCRWLTEILRSVVQIRLAGKVFCFSNTFAFLKKDSTEKIFSLRLLPIPIGTYFVLMTSF